MPNAVLLISAALVVLEGLGGDALAGAPSGKCCVLLGQGERVVIGLGGYTVHCEHPSTFAIPAMRV